MTNNDQDNICLRCRVRENFLEIFKRCKNCSKKCCNQCWIDLQSSNEYKILLDILPKQNHITIKRLCSECTEMLIKTKLDENDSKNQTKTMFNNDNDDDFQLALAFSLSKSQPVEKRKFESENNFDRNKRFTTEQETTNNDENLLEKTAESIKRFMNRAKSNYQRNRDIINDTALLSAFISLQICVTDLEALKHNLNRQRQYYETLQEKLTALRDAREALNILRYEYEEKKRYQKELIEKQRRLMMMQKVADLRQYKHAQIANFQENYFQHLLDEEEKMNEQLKQQKLIKEKQFGL